MTREEAIEILQSAIKKPNTKDGYLGQALDMAIKALEQEPKTGHWNNIPKYKDIAWQCSECGRFTTMKHKYCPNCGAKME